MQIVTFSFIFNQGEYIERMRKQEEMRPHFETVAANSPQKTSQKFEGGNKAHAVIVKEAQKALDITSPSEISTAQNLTSNSTYTLTGKVSAARGEIISMEEREQSIEEASSVTAYDVDSVSLSVTEGIVVKITSTLI